MRILRCHIENFGKWRDRTFDFTEPVTWICQDNGWGKSTLAAFLRAMFYGLEGDRKRSIEGNERKRWQPWQGGVFGGQLTFQAGERQYVISRIFRDKEANDEFELRDAVTNLPSADYSDRIGEELFRINRDSFLRTIFISQNCLAAASATEDIQARIGRTAVTELDSGDYEGASRQLTELLRELTPRRATGRLAKLQGQITTLERQVKEGCRLEDSIRQYEDLLRREQEKLHRCKEEENLLLLQQQQQLRRQEEQVRRQEEQARQREEQLKRQAIRQARWQAKRQEQQRKQAMWQELCDRVAQREQEFEEKGKPFPDSIPDLTELDQQIAKGQALLLQKEQLQGYRIPEEEKRQRALWRQRFSQGVPSEARQQEMWEKERELRQLRREIAAQEKTMAECSILDPPLENREPEPALALGMLRRAGAVIWCVGILLMVAGVLLLSMAGTLPGAAAAIGGLVICLAGVRIRSRAKRRPDETGRQNSSQQEMTLLQEEAGQERKQAGEPSDTQQDELRQKRKQAGELSAVLREYLNQYGLEGEESDWPDLLFELRDQISSYQRYMRQQAASDRLRQECQDGERELEAYLIRYGFQPEREHLIPQLYEIRKALMEYEYAEKLYRDALSRQEAYLEELGAEKDQLITASGALKEIPQEIPQEFFREAPGESLQKSKAPGSYGDSGCPKDSFQESSAGSIRQLQEQAEQVREQIEDIRKTMAGYRDRLNVLQESYEAWSEQREELAAKKEEQAKLSRQYRVAELTKTLLTEARETLTSRYTGPVYRQFQKYYEMVSGESAEAYHLDANLVMTKEAGGKQRETGTLSVGYQDLTGLAMRLALIDAIYQREKPFLILDDPFTNLDESKTRAALELIRQISGQYQIIYFTCTAARAGDNP